MLLWSLRWALLVAAVFGGAFYFVSREGLARKDAPPASGQPDLSRANRAGDFGSEVRIRASADGHYYADAVANNTQVRFLIDTGATSIMLSSADAARMGLRPAQHEYTRVVQTANGVIKLAPTPLREVRIGGFSAYDVDAMVSQAPVDVSLLGMSFLSRLQSWEVRNNQLFLRW